MYEGTKWCAIDSFLKLQTTVLFPELQVFQFTVRVLYCSLKWSWKKNMNDSALFKKVYGSVAAANIGSAIGAAVEWVSVPGGGWKAVEDHFGWVD